MYVYVMRHKSDSNAPFKIGKAKNPGQRLKTIQTGSAEKLRIIHLVKCRSEMHSRHIEAELHSRLKWFKKTGEWYRAEGLCRFREIMDSMIYLNKRKITPAVKSCWTL